MRIFIRVLKLCGVYLATVLLLFGLLIASACIPDSAIFDNMKTSAEFYKTTEAFDKGAGRLQTVSDNYADAILLGIAWNMGKGDALESALDTKYYDGEELGENYGLYASVHNDASPNTDYTRYPHGSAVFVRFCHLFTNVQGMKIIGLAVLILLLLINFVFLSKRGHIGVGIVLVTSFILIQFWNISLSLEYMPTFIIALAVMPFYVLFEDKREDMLLLVSCITGTAVAFFDFLTTETVAILLPLMVVITVRSRENRLCKFKREGLFVLKNTLSFGFAYAATFIFKWTAASIVTGENKFVLALSSAGERFSGEAAGIDNIFTRLPSAIFGNLTAVFGGSADTRINYPLSVIGSVLFIGIIASVIFLFKKNNLDKTAIWMLAAMSMLVFLRFTVLGNHSYLHCFFTHRALVCVVFAALAIVLVSIEIATKKKTRKGMAKR